MGHDGGRRCHVPRLEPDHGDLEESTRAAVLLSIQGMGCVNCANRIHNALITLDGVGVVHIDHRTAQGMVYFDPDRMSEDLILARVAVAAGSSGHRYRASAVALRFH